MDEKDFKKHLQDLAHGHHHPEEHDWAERGAVKTVDEGTARKEKRAKPSASKRKRG